MGENDWIAPDLESLDALAGAKMINVFIVDDDDVRVGTDEGISAAQFLLAAEALRQEALELMNGEDDADAG